MQTHARSSEPKDPNRMSRLTDEVDKMYGAGKVSRIEMLRDRVLVKPVAEAETVKGGIIIPSTAQEKPQEGVVVDVGPGLMDPALTTAGQLRRKPDVNPGDHVLFGKYGGTEITVDDVDYLILREEDILARLHR